MTTQTQKKKKENEEDRLADLILLLSLTYCCSWLWRRRSWSFYAIPISVNGRKCLVLSKVLW